MWKLLSYGFFSHFDTFSMTFFEFSNIGDGHALHWVPHFPASHYFEKGLSKSVLCECFSHTKVQ
jgi:hypothetical protein